MKAPLLSFCLKAISSNILSSVASASGSLDLQRTREQRMKGFIFDLKNIYISYRK